jgi:hypothetical protein
MLGFNIGGRPTRAQYQYTLQDANLDELNQWSLKIFDKLKTIPELRDVASDQQTGGATLTLTIDRDRAARFGIQPQLIDVGLRRVAEIAGATVARAILLDIGYDPDPPFDAGHPGRAPDDVKAHLSSRYEKARTDFRAGIKQSSVL